MPTTTPSSLRTSMRTTLRLTAIAAAIAQACALTSSAYAQSDDQALPEVIISANKQLKEKPITNSVAGFVDAPLQDTPVSMTVFSRQQMQDLRIRSSTDAMKFDASVNDAYNAVGYAEQFSIRGFALDNTSSYRKDGLAIPGDASIPLENKERIEILKGLAGFQAGFATPGGIINYVLKRPTAAPLRSLSIETSERGTLYGTADLGGQSDDRQFGYRINAAAEKIRSYVKGADGERQFASAAFDWHMTPQALLQLDLDYQRKSQLTVPGYQLFNGTDLPRGINPDIMLNDQPWAKPVFTRSSNIGLRFEYRFSDNWRASFSANRHEFKRDDYTAFPYGCTAANLYPGYCANGDYDVYDYQSVNESKSPVATQAILSGKWLAGAFRHNLAIGFSSFQRRDRFGDYVYDYVGGSNVFRPAVVPPSGNVTGPVLLRRTDKEWSVFAQDIIDLSDAWKLHAGLRHVAIRRQQIDSPGYDRSYQLPSLALVFKPQSNISIYASFSEGLEHGGIAPIGTGNVNQVLNPAKSRQVEIGVKADLNRDVSISAAAFRIKKPLEYTNTANVYVSNGSAIHNGLELTVQGRVTPALSLGGSLTALDARQSGTGIAGLDDKRVTNVPARKSVIYLDYAIAGLPGLSLNGSWNYAGDKAFQPDNSVMVPGYSVFNLGTRYHTRLAGVATTLRVNIDNVSDKFYWRDVTQSLGGYLFPGAPRVFKVSAQFDF
ncbi:TonB-dependent siderophore receptor [Undibacterium sp. Jales W-56]|uniref:TonB-dependent siderophore receptor n=1 Tax=Undibacterium sp. Jales W-56 TaxID=2897325 RepID=UPI0021D019D5|nr:TonB-dependent siderophore receptor [Undibacterium sp. Jales W-56]MCU6433040.1 TonB-dependent siderophore receptor [Undibacterium sp. Jales W-56]